MMMNRHSIHRWVCRSLVATLVGTGAFAHDGSHGNAELDAMIAQWRAAQVAQSQLAPVIAAAAPAGYGATMAASFGAFKPRVRFYWDGTTFYVESDNVPDNTRMPNLMVGISSWQQQVPLPTSYFASTTNPERDQGSIGYGKPNVWRLPLVPVPSASPIPISAGNFQRGAIAVGADGIAIFNPRNNTGRVSYEIGELDIRGPLRARGRLSLSHCAGASAGGGGRRQADCVGAGWLPDLRLHRA